MPGRVGAINTTREHRNRVPTRSKCGPVSCTLDAVRATGDDDTFLLDKVTGGFSRYVLSI